MKSNDFPQRYQHGGNLRRLSAEVGIPTEDLLDFSANLNPLGPPEWLRSEISSHVSDLVHYPDPDCGELTKALAAANQVTEENLLVGNGATELLYLLPRALGLNKVLIPVPSYADYEDAALQAGLEVEHLLLEAEHDFAIDFEQLAECLHPDQLVLLGQPNNPTGRLFDSEQLRELIQAAPQTYFVVDESFISFTSGAHSMRWQRPANVIVIESMTKAYAIPGLRLGYLIADPDIVISLRRLMPDWTVNTLAQRVGCRALADKDYLNRSRDFVALQRQALTEALSDFPGLKVFPGDANFLLLRLDVPGMTAGELARRMLIKGIAVRVCDNFKGLGQSYFRVAVRTAEEQDRLCSALREVLGSTRVKNQRRKTPAIMFQGTGSNAGKSVLTAAMCRILQQDGYDVAPFKAQNMSLNSFVTMQGGEMGRAQVVQAQACRLEPDVRMNPVLLKPNSETGSQVILNGKVWGSMHFRDYSDRRQMMFATVKESYDSLAADHDVMVLEGAGSPAEINLKDRDIVNMNMAHYADAPVLLVGDIDRGGVFASFVGTMELLSEIERRRIAGFVINRFRGDQSFLTSALEHTLRHTGKPVFGVVPYLARLGLPEEDSVSFKAAGFQQVVPAEGKVDIAVLDLPHISNFTDFEALSIEPDVHLRVVRSVDEIGSPDALILPGSKNVLDDLAYLQERGFADAILQLAESDAAEIVGICGGFQILGEQVSDPQGVESAGKTKQGLALLPVETTLAEGKTTTQTRTVHLPSGHELVGYEIHHGRTEALSDHLQTVMHNDNGEMVGGSIRNNRIWGTYLHGVFDADEFRRWFVDQLRMRRGWSAEGCVLARYDLEPALDRLADTVRESLDIKAIYQRMGL